MTAQRSMKELHLVADVLVAGQVHDNESLERVSGLVEGLTRFYLNGDKSLAPVLEYYTQQVVSYESKLFGDAREKVSGVEVLRHLMDDHGHRLTDLSDVASKSVLSRILSGERTLNRNHIEKLATKYSVSPAVFF